MKIISTSIVPIRISNTIETQRFMSECISSDIIHRYDDYKGHLNLYDCTDIIDRSKKYFYIPSDNYSIFVIFKDYSMVLCVSKEDCFDDYYAAINATLHRRNEIVKNLNSIKTEIPDIKAFFDKIRKNNGFLDFNYAFSFCSIFEPTINKDVIKHAKILAEPSIINMDDMLSTDLTSVLYTAQTKMDKNRFNHIDNIDIDSNQYTFVTWASIVSVTNSEQKLYRNHTILILLEQNLQRLWHLCYTQNKKINKYLTSTGSKKDIQDIINDTYTILIDSKRMLSETYSTRLSIIEENLVDTSKIKNYISDLEQNLHYLISYTNAIFQQKNKRAQELSEILLFIVAIAQVIPIFYKLPINIYNVYSHGILIVLICLGIIIIGRKYR